MGMNDLWGKGGGPLQASQRYLVLTSRTIVAPFTGKMILRGAAPAGSGARPPAGGNATGAGAGEYVEDVVYVTKDDAFTFTVSAPGAAVSVANTAGNDGGDLTVTGPNGYALVMKGGKAGQRAASGPVPGGLGGANGTGGSPKVIRSPGGRGGDVTGATATNKITGGGGVNPFFLTPQTATRGGDISKNDAVVHATGGGGVGGHGGDLVTAATNGSGGGGSGGDAPTDSPNGGVNFFGEVATTTSPASLVLSAVALLIFDIFGGSGIGTTNGSVTNSGGGSGGPAASALNIPGAAGALGGGGAVGGTGNGSGNGKFGGGGGAAALGTTGPGGQGWVDVQFVRGV